MRTILSFICFCAAISLSAQPTELSNYNSVFEAAVKADKQVILVFGHEYCGWCRIFDRYHADPVIKDILEPEYIIHEIDILESAEGRILFDYYLFPGTPAWMIFNTDKKVLADGKDKTGRMIGYPYSQTEIAEYLSCIRETSRNIGDPQLEVLRQKLQEYGNSK